VEEARRLGCRIEVPCVNRSEVGATGCRGALRLGLAQVKGLREGTPEEVVRVREAKGLYVSFGDLLLRTTLERAEVERLVLAGALDVFDRPRPELLWHVTLDYDRYAKVRAEEAGRRGAGRLFGREAFLAPRRVIPVPPDYPPARLLELEMETLGLTATAHPMALVRDAAKRHGAVATTALAPHVGGTVSVAGFVVTDRRVRTAKGRYMKFLMLEDLSGTVEAVLFPEAYHRLGPRLSGPGPFLATGLVRRDHGALTLDVREVALLAPDEEP
jgi:DNA polymerase III alpha subunit